MNTLKAIKKRESVRKFKNKKPDWRNIIEAIDSTRYAPMAGNIFSLKFLISQDSEKIKKIARWSEQPFIAQAKYIVIFVSNPKATQFYGERGKKYLTQQAGAAIQNFLLHLTEVGLSTCWIGHFNDEQIKTIFKMPEKTQIEAIFPIGYEDKKFKKKKEKKPKGEIYKMLNFEEWGNSRMKKQEYIESRGPEGY